MGGSMSCGGCQPGNCLTASTFFTGPNQYRFAAEIFKLSDDRSEWLKIHPSVLSVTVSRKTSVTGADAAVAELSAVNLKQQNVFQIPIQKDAEIKRYSDRFVYWKDCDTVYALNVVSRTDVEQFCAVASDKGAVQPKPDVARVFRCEMAPLMSARHGHIVEHESLRLNECSLVFRPPDSLQVLDKDDQHLFSTSALEVVLSVNEPRRLLFMSFPSKALALCFKQSDDLRAFCHTVLNESSISIAGGTRSHEHVLSWLNRTLDSVVALIRGNAGACNAMTASTSSSGIDLSADPRLPGHAVAASKHYMETLYSLKYMLVFRIASLKGIMPNSNFSEVVFPTELRARVSSGYLSHYVHLYCCLHAQFSIKKQLKDISGNAHYLRPLSPVKTRPEPQPSTSKEMADEGKGTHERLLKSIIELVQTEATFVRDLEQLLQQYIRAAQLTFLECTDKLQKTHSLFLTALQDASGDLLTASSSAALEYTQIKDAVMRIAALFINKCNKFKIYSEYSAAYLRFQHLQHADAELKAKLDALNTSGQHNESIQSLLIKPIQRVLKYPLFLEQIRDFCTKGSMEQKQCVQALNRMQTLACYVNEMQRIYEQYGEELDRLAKLPELSAKGLWLDLRDLFMFAHLKWMQAGEKKYTDCVAFVFTSLILVLGPSVPGKKKQPRRHRILPIHEVQINELAPSPPGADPGEHFFSVTHVTTAGSSKGTTFHVSCCHVDIKTHFVKSAKKALRMYLKQKPRPISGSSQSDWGYASGH